MTEDADAIWSALGYALTGERFDVSSQSELHAELREHGWSSQALQRHRDECRAKDRPWPYRLSASELGTFGAARFQAALTTLRHELGVEATIRRVSAHGELSAVDRRYLEDRPPHHGSV